MSETAWLALAVVLVLIVGPFATLRARSRRRAAPGAVLPAGWQERLQALLPPLQQLPAQLRQRHHAAVERFLHGKRFVGCGGLQVSDDMRLAIAGLACLLVLRQARPRAPFPAVRSVLVYPRAFLVPVDEPDELGLVSDEPELRVGESWQGDRVILSWEDVQAALAGDEVNVVVHEFAHQLDDEGPASEGMPALTDYARWSAVMQQEFERLQRHRRPPVLDPYGAASPAEFFGVVVEAFIQRGAELAQHHPQLYRLMHDSFGYDTRNWRWEGTAGE